MGGVPGRTGTRRPSARWGRHLEDGLEDDAQPLECPFGQHVAVIRVDGAGDRQRHDLVAVAHAPAELLGSGKAQQQAGMIDELGRALGGGMLGEIGRRGAQDPLDIGDLAQGEARVAHLREADRHVDGLLHEVEQMIGEPKVDVRLRVALAEGGDQRRHDAPAERQRGGDLQRPARRGALGLDALLRALHGGGDVEAAVVEDAAGLRQVHPPRRAGEQQAAEMLLQRLDAVADHRGRQAQGAAGRREAAGLRRAHEDADTLQGQHPPPSPPRLSSEPRGLADMALD
ncbi:hypothetical protein PKCBPO_00490 [Methylorubrum thiocyanatum]